MSIDGSIYLYACDLASHARALVFIHFCSNCVVVFQLCPNISYVICVFMVGFKADICSIFVKHFMLVVLVFLSGVIYH